MTATERSSQTRAAVFRRLTEYGMHFMDTPPCRPTKLCTHTYEFENALTAHEDAIKAPYIAALMRLAEFYLILDGDESNWAGEDYREAWRLAMPLIAQEPRR